MNKFIAIIIAILVFFVSGGVAGYTIASRHHNVSEITAEVIAQEMQKEGFLITQSALLSENVTIEKKSGNRFKDFFLGQTITAQAVLQVDRGIDLTKIRQSDILVEENRIEIALPQIETRSVEIIGSVTLHNSEGIAKKLLDSEDGYNEAIAMLKEQATAVVMESAFEAKAKESAREQVERFVRLIGSKKQVVIIN